MATAISGASIIDAVLFVVAANEPCPMPQTREHLMILNLIGIKDVVIVQTKIDIVGKEKAKAHYGQIRAFVKGSAIEGAPVVPVISGRGVNIDVLLEKISQFKPVKRDSSSDPIMYVVRSFDVNKPGTKIAKLVGGVIGGAVIRGRFRAGDTVEMRPGISIVQGDKETYRPAITKIESMNNGTDDMEEAAPGGLIGVSTDIDPAFVKADSMVGNVVGHVGKLPESVKSIAVKYTRISRTDLPEQGMRDGEPLLLGVGTATVVGYIKKMKRDNLEIDLNHPICAEPGAKIAVLRNMDKRWRLTGYAVMSAKR
jgi:translation initiation factor 2 subunit 3